MRKIINVFLAVSITFLCCEINGGNDMAPSSKPDKLPEFASTDVVDGVTGQNNVVEPPEAKKDAGWNFLEKPSRNWMNWIHRKSWQWLVYFNQFFSSTHQFKINEIIEFDVGNGIDIDGVLIKDNKIEIDEINEKTSGSGVGIETSDGSILRTKIIDIGDWNMQTTTSLIVAHGLTLSKIRKAEAMIRRDDDARYYPFIGDGGNILDGGISYIDSTYVVLAAKAVGVFNSSNFNDLSFNRGWITIQYID